MLSKILTKEDCKNCKFCCAFQRKSLWETPTFYELPQAALLNGTIQFCKNENGATTIDLQNQYQTDIEQEEAECFFLDKQTGCTLSEFEKPFDCKIWPFRVMRDGEKVFISLATTCPALAQKDENEILEFVQSELLQKVKSEIQNHPNMIHKMHKNYKKILEITL